MDSLFLALEEEAETVQAKALALLKDDWWQAQGIHHSREKMNDRDVQRLLAERMGRHERHKSNWRRSSSPLMHHLSTGLGRA